MFWNITITKTAAPGPNNELINVALDYDPSVRQTEIQDSEYSSSATIAIGVTAIRRSGCIAGCRIITPSTTQITQRLCWLRSVLAFTRMYSAATALQSTTELNSIEAQHIFQNDLQNIIVGTRYQTESGPNEQICCLIPPYPARGLRCCPGIPHVDSDFERFSAYGYYQLKLFDSSV